MQYLVCTKRGSKHDVIESDAHESNGPSNVSISRGLSSFHSKIDLAVATEIDLSKTILYLYFSTCIIPVKIPRLAVQRQRSSVCVVPGCRYRVYRDNYYDSTFMHLVSTGCRYLRSCPYLRTAPSWVWNGALQK
jgi:hypothetical protein